MAATWLQSWRLRTISSKISHHIKEKSSICFYNISTNSTGTHLPNVSSELCTNHSQARIKDILWYLDQQRGCILLPMQKINLGPWITFPSTSQLIPFEFQKYNNASFDKNSENIFLLIETDVIPSFSVQDNFMIETFGLPIAWKIDSHLAILLKTDIKHLSELIISSFMRNCYFINDKLRLSRIESVIIVGEPQPYDLLKKHLSKESLNRSVRFLNAKQWEKHLNGLRSLGVLANQAIEYEQTNEGKKHLIKPDLIPLKTVEEIIVRDQTPSTSKNPPQLEIIENAVISEIKPETPIHVEKNVPLENAIIPELPPSTPISIEKNALSDKLQVKKKVIPQSIEKVVPLKQPEKIVSQKKLEKSVSPKQPDKNVLSKKVEKPQAVTPPKKNLDIKSTKIVPQKNNEKSIKPKNVEKETKKMLEEKNDEKLCSNAGKLSGANRPSLKRTKGNTIINKPPNILVYSDSLVTRDNVITTINRILDKNMYTIYPLTKQQVKTKIWFDNTILLVVCGTITDDIKNILLDYFLIGGKMFSLCSDLLNIVLPNYHTAEVREHELVQFSYGKWSKIKMMHHVFCYQPSPVRKHFSHDGEEPQTPQLKSIMMCPRFVEVKDQQGVLHYLQVEVLGTEETWNTPSLMLANNSKNGGRAVFSQVHLETDPTLYEADEIKYNILKNSDNERLEILTDILSTQLDMSVTKILNEKPNPINLCGYFLGRHESKYQFLEKLSDLKLLSNNENQLKNKYFNIKFLDKKLIETNNMNRHNYLPILINSCPDNFSTVDYFENLKTDHIGRLVIYTPIITSTMNILSELTLTHGLVIIAKEQTLGSGRHENQWLSPEGCCMFSLQLHIPLASPLGQRIPLVQHLIAISIINSILKIDGYGDLDINIKWPNDIYCNDNIKIGGLIINSLIDTTNAICNIGCGINLNNNKPTTCINNIINDYNLKNDKNLNLINYENYLALIFTEIELLYNQIQNGDLKLLYDLYYKYWLHSNTEVTIMDENIGEKKGKIIGIDDYGYLLVQIDGQLKPETVHPDGNSFDMLRGLIMPK